MRLANLPLEFLFVDDTQLDKWVAGDSRRRVKSWRDCRITPSRKAGAYLRSLSFDNARGLLRIPKAEDQLQIKGQGGSSIKVQEIARSLWPCAGRSL
jgi:hypothetical protein